MTSKSLPLAGIKVLDFTTLLPGPLATLLLAEAGAEVIKIERQGGEDLRRYPHPFGEASVNFALLNRGKRSLYLDLKDPADRRQLDPYLAAADVMIEQFRPGVMDRLGLGFERLRKTHPRLIYCSISGYGQEGRRRLKAGHDLNYLTETGILGLTRGADGAPALPPVLVGDIGAGAYPAIINILLALRQRESSGEGCQIDISMTDNLFAFAYWGLGAGFGAGAWPRPSRELVTGASPRYQIYRTADDGYLAAAPLEDHFWRTFCDAIDLPAEERDDSGDPERVKQAVARLIAADTTENWRSRLVGLDACVSVVISLEEAANDPDFADRALFSRQVCYGDRSMPALPIPLVPALRRTEERLEYPLLSAANAEAR